MKSGRAFHRVTSRPICGRRSATLGASLLVLALAACSGESTEPDGQGNLSVELWGESYIESGIPADDFVDGWSVEFDRFLVSLGAITASRPGEAADLAEPGFRIWDLAAADGPMAVVSALVPAGSYAEARYRISPASASVELGNATATDRDAMVSGGYSVLAQGVATNGARSVHFEWGFDRATSYGPCASTAVLADGGDATVQITVHGDHFFYDSAVSSDPVLRFEDIALADADDDGEVIRSELEAYDITPLDHYAVGSLEIYDLWAYLAHMSTTVGHIDGEGHCHTEM